MVLNQNLNLKSQNQSLKLKTDLRERCYRYSVSVIKFLTDLPEKRAYQILSDQLLRSATSIGVNIVEAKSASSKRDFIRVLRDCLEIG